MYAWEHVCRAAEVILVEGLFDYAALWQAGFRNVTCALGTQLNAHQLRQLCSSPRTVHLAFDADANGSGQHAAQRLAEQLSQQGITAHVITLPEGHDPHSLLTAGGDARQFRTLLETPQS